MTNYETPGQTTGAGPVGYTNPSFAEFRRERERAEYNDRGQKNTKSSGYHLDVWEEERYFDNRNTSLQSVGVGIFSMKNSPNSFEREPRVYVGSDRNGEDATLYGQPDGNVFLSLERDDGTKLFHDITTAAARAGITAAGIRRTQQDIAADGEVSRPEQQQIINLIARAKAAAGVLR